MKPLFSILIANYNNAKYLAECLASVLNQDYTNLEVILVDDGSTDHSLSIIEPFLKEFSNLKLFTNDTNKGVGYAKARCIAESSGEILGIVDADDKLESNAVSEMVAAHALHPNAALVYSNLYYCDAQLKVTGIKKIAQVPLGKHDFFNQADDISHFCTFKKAAYLKTSGRDTTLRRADDQDLYLKLYDVGDAILLNQPLYHYRIHDGGVSTLANEDKAFFERWNVIFQRATEKEIDIENLFLQTFVRRERVKHWLKLDAIIRSSWLFKLARKIVK